MHDVPLCSLVHKGRHGVEARKQLGKPKTDTVQGRALKHQMFLVTRQSSKLYLSRGNQIVFKPRQPKGESWASSVGLCLHRPIVLQTSMRRLPNRCIASQNPDTTGGRPAAAQCGRCQLRCTDPKSRLSTQRYGICSEVQKSFERSIESTDLPFPENNVASETGT